MSVENVGADKAALPQRHLDLGPRHQRQFKAGDELQLTVIERLANRHYRVALGNTQRLAYSDVELPLGSNVRVTVTADAGRLELRYLAGEAHASSDQHAAASIGDGMSLAQLESRYSVRLPDAERDIVQRTMSRATQPQLVATSGLFLGKLGLPLSPDALQALHAAQAWSAPQAGLAARTTGVGTVAIAAVDATQVETAMHASLLERAPNAATNANVAIGAMAAYGMSSVGGSSAENSNHPRDLARRLLNVQDRGSVGYQYGVLPVLVGDQLVELSLVYFSERELTEQRGSRRLVMSFSTASLGRVEIEARAMGDRLAIAIRTDARESSRALEVHAGEVRDLVRRLGWNVETVAYEVDLLPHKAAGHILKHVLHGDTLSRLL